MAILYCTCHHQFQDQRYGSHKRVHNPKAKSLSAMQEYRCTVCGREKTKAGATKPE